MMHYIRMTMYAALSAPASELLGALSFTVVLWYGGRRVIDGSLPAENLVLFVAAMLFVLTPLKNLSKLSTVVQQSLASAQRIFGLLDVPRELAHDGSREARFQRELRFEHVDFEYVTGEPVLRDVSFRAGRGEVVAIVGSSGAGKTTLVDLVPRFYLPTRGRITLDGEDTREFTLRSLRALMGIVTQETILFNDTVYSNIVYGSPEATREQVERAARAANAHDFILELPRGYETVVGDRGAQLSGGQRQRLAIARAILRDPEILIFDEATSALDSESERLVQEAMDRLLEGRTTFVIAHRLSTIRHADRILVLDRGRLSEHGTHAELMDRRGVYHRLYQIQFGHAGV
jgi:subfamily B ATP-binding cassette protein MsbA